MPGVEVRQARADEIPYLRKRLAESSHEEIALDRARAWIAVKDGAIVGVLCARMVWQMEPLYLFPECENKITRSRAMFRLYQIAESWIGDRTRNLTGIHWFFGITRSKEVLKWADRIGYRRVYEGAAMLVKHL